MRAVRELLDGLLARSTPARPAWNQEALRESGQPRWNYIDGCMAQAVLAMYEATGEPRYRTFLETFIDYYIAADGTIRGYRPEEYNCDNINEGKVLFALSALTGQGKYKIALDTLYRQLARQPRTKSGNFWHKKIYPDQIWLDGLYMVQPFYLQYEREFCDNRHYRDIFEQFQNVRRLMRDPQTGLLYHGYDESRTCAWADPVTGLSPNFWSRSLGWYAMALVDTLAQLDEQFFYEADTLRQSLREVLDALRPWADAASGLLYQVTTAGPRPGNYLETSGSCAIAYALLKGARLRLLPEYYAAAGERILRSIVRHKLAVGPNGHILKDICLVAGLGGMPGKGSYRERDGSYAYYISEPVVDNDAKGVAPLVMAYAEYLRKEGDKQ